ncbi:TIGR01459 family HAD-type hydrolase [Sneathiella aquimaris]|uniref:TIGR01459 family HAD-type hydrolase n=1 Tax=Sneathiella aquimaris TaxID=2599305 RepID=UPI00146B67AD|nr:TIGR01459 family HAD-type hydrolase [Sneathiella aquimaris]
MSFQFMPGLAQIADQYDAYILDLWGVVHDGTRPYPGALNCMQQLRANGKPLLLLSNAPRTNGFVENFLETLGVSRSFYDQILTSGDLTREVLTDRRFDYLKKENLKFYQFGADKDRGLDDGLDYTRVFNVAQADFLICTGLAHDDVETPENYRALLAEAARLNLPMLCANPDLTVMKGDRMLYCAGALAALYEELGGQVTLFGKPYANAYEQSMQKLGVSDPSKILAVGDSMRTDIKGANGMQIDCVLCSGGIHAEEWGLTDGGCPTDGQVKALVDLHGFSPTYVVGHMTW